jgi:predicted permease
MLNQLVAVVCVYSFILLGYLAKKIFKDEIHEKSLILISVYFLQPILVFWGLTSTPLDLELIKVPFIYILIIFITLFFTYFIGRLLFKDIKDSSIFTVSALIGNTGNLGIPLGLAIFGESSLIYTSMINIMNIFFIYTIGIYFYARGSYDFAQSIKSMIKIPILWSAIIAILFNISDIEISENIKQSLQMGGYSAMVLQLMIFGIYLYSVKLKHIDIKLNISVVTVKAFVLPFIAFITLILLGYNNDIGAIIFLQLCVPLAVNNVNLASLYNCKPIDMASIILFTSIIFLLLIGVYTNIIKNFF